MSGSTEQFKMAAVSAHKDFSAISLEPGASGMNVASPSQQQVDAIPGEHQPEAQSFGKDPTNIICPHCEENSETTTSIIPGRLAITSRLLVRLINWCPRFWVACCHAGCTATDHVCSNCGGRVGTYHHN